MRNSRDLISALRVVAEEISRFRKELQTFNREIKGLANAISPDGRSNTTKNTMPSEQTREEWLKEAAIRASKNLFTG